jgi:probable HAF family extracellular repeat protein
VNRRAHLAAIVALTIAGCGRGNRSEVQEQRTAALTAPRYRMVDLGTLGGDSSDATALNESMQVVGTSRTASGLRHCFLWDAGLLTDLGHLGGDICTPRAINESGQIVGASRAAGGDRAFLYDGGTMADLGTIGARESEARFINDSGLIVGRFAATGIGGCFIYAAGAMTEIKPGTDCFPTGLSNAGQLLGETHSFADGTQQPFLYQPGVGFIPVDGRLLTTPSDARDINETGAYTGTTLGPAGDVRGYVYIDGSLRIIEAPGEFNVGLLAIDDAGRVVVQFVSPNKDETSFRALWEAGTVHDLRPFEPLDSNAAGHLAGTADGRAAAYRGGAIIDLGAPAPSAATHINEAGAIIGYAPFVNPTTGESEQHATLWIPLASDGDPCLANSECSSDLCVDGVCCETACGGGDPADCQACSVAAGAPANGVCATLGSSHDCRGSTGPCDPKESCSGATSCPPDVLSPSGTTCGTSSGVCDVAGTCSGLDGTCGPNGFSPGTRCYQAASFCASIEQTLSCLAGSPVCPTPTPWPTDGCATAGAGTTSVDLLGGQDEPGGVTVTFPSPVPAGSGIAAQGPGQFAPPDDPNRCPPATGFAVVQDAADSTGQFWNIDVSAGWPATPATVCVHYSPDPNWPPGFDECSLQLFHGATIPPAGGACTPEDAAWTSINIGGVTAVCPSSGRRCTISGAPGATCQANTICGMVPDHFSPFAVFAPLPGFTPTVTVPADMIVAATSTAGATASFSASAVDPTDGPLTPVCTPASGSTFPAGGTAVTCTATNSLGISRSATFAVWVQYDAPAGGAFFLPPIDAAGDSRFKRGTTIPVKFRLTGASAGITNLVARLYVARAVNGVAGPYEEADATPACDENTFRYDPRSRQYVFNLSTRNMATGSWSLRADLGDLVDHTVDVSLR